MDVPFGEKPNLKSAAGANWPLSEITRCRRDRPLRLRRVISCEIMPGPNIEKINCTRSKASSKTNRVMMFKRLPSLRWHPPRDQQIVSMKVQKQSPLFADDFKTLDDELLNHRVTWRRDALETSETMHNSLGLNCKSAALSD